MGRVGFIIDEGSPDCKHQSLASMCGYEYCLNCSWKFFGHCTACIARHAKLKEFIDLKLKEFHLKKLTK